MSTQYTLTVKNESTLSGSVCVYQRNPEQKKYSNLYSVAWFAKSCHPNTTLKFRWYIDYCFVWSQTGILRPGVYFDASEVKTADPTNSSLNATGFSMEGGAYKFTDPVRPANPGSLDIQTNATIPNHGVSVGVGMSGNPTFALEATPNFTFSFMPHPEYWVAFGDFEEGEVMDINRVSSTAQVSFPINVYSRTITFRPDNTWSEPVNLLDLNTALLNAAK